MKCEKLKAYVLAKIVLGDFETWKKNTIEKFKTFCVSFIKELKFQQGDNWPKELVFTADDFVKFVKLENYHYELILETNASHLSEKLSEDQIKTLIKFHEKNTWFREFLKESVPENVEFNNLMRESMQQASQVIIQNLENELEN